MASMNGTFFAALFLGAIACSVLGDVHDACPLCSPADTACVSDEECAALLTDLMAGQTPTAETLQNDLFIALWTCRATPGNCPDDQETKEGESDCPVCIPADLACAGDPECGELALGMGMEGRGPTAEEMENELMAATVQCHMTNCPSDPCGTLSGKVAVNHIHDDPGELSCECVPKTDPCVVDGGCVAESACFEQLLGAEEADNDEGCSMCRAADTACYLDADCGPMLASLQAEERSPTAEEMENELMAAMMQCRMTQGNCPNEGPPTCHCWGEIMSKCSTTPQEDPHGRWGTDVDFMVTAMEADGCIQRSVACWIGSTASDCQADIANLTDAELKRLTATATKMAGTEAPTTEAPTTEAPTTEAPTIPPVADDTTTTQVAWANHGENEEVPVEAFSLDQVAEVGATKIEVSERLQARAELGDSITIDPGTDVEETVTVNGFGSILFEPPLQFSHPAGTPALLTKSAGVGEAAAAPRFAAANIRAKHGTGLFAVLVTMVTLFFTTLFVSAFSQGGVRKCGCC